MTDKVQIKSFIEDLKTQLLAMYNIGIISIKDETFKYRFSPAIDDFLYIEIKFLGGFYNTKMITVAFRLDKDALKGDNYLNTLKYYTLDFGCRVYDELFGHSEGEE